MNESVIKIPKFMFLIMMLYITVGLSSVVMIYYVTRIQGIAVSAASLIIPFWFVLGDIAAEVYGYKIFIKMIVYMILCEFVFILIISILIRLPVTGEASMGVQYNLIFHDLYRVFIGSAVSILCAFIINVKILLKWKALLRGRYFFIRSIGSSAIGELFFTAIAFSLEFFGRVSLYELLQLVFISSFIKLAFLPLIAAPAAVISNFLKRTELIHLKQSNQEINILENSL